jgi:hypothetical protein
MIKLKFSQLEFYKKLIPISIFLVISVGLFYLMGYGQVANKGPFSRHMYRQSDSYAFALNYYYENNKLLEPSVLFELEDKGGKTASEFPVLYYFSAKIWKLTGVNPLVPRLMNLIILFIGLFYLYKLSYEILQDHFWSFLVSLLMFSSPLLSYYGFNFIPNIPALGFALIATYYYYKYYTSSKVQFLILATLLFVIGALLKISSLFTFLAINAVFFLQNTLWIKQKRKAILMQLGSVVFVFVMVFSWYLFSKNYNVRNADGLFRQDIIPIWNLTPEHIQKILDVVYTNTIIYFLNPFALIALAGLFATSIVLWRKTSTTLLLITSILFLGVVMFILLFFEAMDAHEYFLIDATVIIPAIILTFLTTMKGWSLKVFNSIITKSLAFVLLGLSLNYSVVITRDHYNPKDKMVTDNIPLPKRVQDYWDYCYWDWELGRGKFEGITPYIRSLGIKFDDKVISIPDESPNITLTLLQQKGFTDYHYWNNYEGIKRTERKIELGAKYLIVQGDENLLRNDVAPFISNQIGEYNGIKIYRLKIEE